ncbi:hypothetical protein C0992_011397, partial [Termitomyces sp. T32_za158]
MFEPVRQTTRFVTPTKTPKEPPTLAREYASEVPAYFDLPVVIEPQPEATEEFKEQLDKVSSFLPNVETSQHIDPSISLREDSQLMPVNGQAPPATYNAREMPAPEPEAHPSVASRYSPPQFESDREVWRVVVPPKMEEIKRDINTMASTWSIASSIRSVPTNNPDDHHDQGTSSVVS